MIELILPVPVSLSSAYLNNKKIGRVKSPEARAWAHEALLLAAPFVKQYRSICDKNILLRRGCKAPNSLRKLMNEKGIRPSYAVVYRFTFFDDGVRDLANFEKLLSDFLTDFGFLLDDQYIDDLRFIRMPSHTTAPHVKITITDQGATP